MSDRAAASCNIVLKLTSGPRKIVMNWITEENNNPSKLGLPQRYSALDEVLDEMDLSTADSIICPIHLG
jgi:hypothetical protein